MVKWKNNLFFRYIIIKDYFSWDIIIESEMNGVFNIDGSKEKFIYF